MADVSGRLVQVSWKDVFWSTLVVGAGWALAMGVPTLDRFANSSIGDSTLMLLIGGPAIGVAQWIVTTRRFGSSALWAVAYSLGWAGGLWSGIHWGEIILHPLAMGAAGGAIVGILQALTLQRHVRNVGIWVVASTVISMAGCWIGTWAGLQAYDRAVGESSAYLIGGAVCGLVIGLLTSLCLRWLLQRGHRD